MIWGRALATLLALSLVVQCALVASSAAYAAFAHEAIDLWTDRGQALIAWHEPYRYLLLAERLDPLTSAHPEARGELDRWIAGGSLERRDEHLRRARQAFAEGLRRAPSDGILWARQAALLATLGDEAAITPALEEVRTHAPFEPPALLLVADGVAPHWHRLDPRGRELVLILAGNALLQARDGVRSDAARLLRRRGVLSMACRRLSGEGHRPEACSRRDGARGAI